MNAHEYDKGYKQGYRDAQLGLHCDPVMASSEFRRGYLHGHQAGTFDARIGVDKDGR